MYSVIVALIALLYILHIYRKRINNFCKSKKDLNGKTAIVTGGTSGIGLQAAIDFARRGARVIIACPFKGEGINAKTEIETRTNNKNVIFKLLDLSSIQSVRDFAANIIETENRLDILVNNAGVGVPDNFTTEDGMSFIMQVNYYGHFLLTLLLLPLLKKSGTPAEKSRIVCLSSIMHRLATSDVRKYNHTGYYLFNFTIYSNSKLSLILFARELSKILKNSNVVVNCVDPGVVSTGIFHSANRMLAPAAKIIISLFFKNQWEGVQTTLYAVLEEETGNVSGQLIKNCKLIRARRLAYDDEKAELLWKNSIKLVGLSDGELEHLLN